MSNFIHINSHNGIFQKNFTTLISNSLKISHRILFHCSSLSDSFLAIGCNTGNIYIFKIQNSKFKYWSNIISNDSPVDGMTFSSKNYLAYYNKKFQIFIYKLNVTNEKNRLVRQIDNSQNSPIQLLLWDDESSKIFCGYSNGVIDVCYIPHNTKDYFHASSDGLLKLDRQDIVQMDFFKDLLLVSTNEKVILLNIQSKYMTFIGSKPRSGQYGACFWFDAAKQLRIVSARPGYRLWIASVDGTVEETQQYKTWNNSLKYTIKSNEVRPPGSGQFAKLTMIKNSNLIIAIEHEGLIFIMDLIKKTSVSVIDYGTSLSKILHNGDNLILNSQREVVCLSVTTAKEALVLMLDEDTDCERAIDLFLTFKCDSEDESSTSYLVYDRQIVNTLSPDLLSRIVQKSAELDYRFFDTNKLQVYIQDNSEYQNIFCTLRNIDKSTVRGSTSTIDSSIDASTDSDCSNDPNKQNRKSGKKLDKAKSFVKKTQLLQTIYDKTSHLLSSIDALSSSNSDCHLSVVESSSGLRSREDFEIIDTNSRQSIAQNMSENLAPGVNFMELEANGYIACEKYKQHHLDDVSNNDFLESLTNFCETWLIINLNYWQQLSYFELHVRNLSATFAIVNPRLSVGSNDSFQFTGDNDFLNAQLSAQFSNSWSCTISASDWLKTLHVPEKIYQMTSTLLSLCFFYETFSQFPQLIQKLTDVSDIADHCSSSQCSVQCYPNSYYEGVFDQETQMTLLYLYEGLPDATVNHHYEDLTHILVNNVWNPQSETCWIRSIIKYFHDFLNIKSIRQWMRSGISHNVWLMALHHFKEAFFAKAIGDVHKPLSELPDSDLDKMLFDYLCKDDIHSFVVVDEIISVMNGRNFINWKILIESENLDCRDILHFSLKYNLDLTEYISELFKHVNFSIRFSSRYSLLEHIYSQSDVLVSFVYSLLANRALEENSQGCCDCGLLIIYSELNLPENINSLAIEILKWGGNHGIFKKDSNLLNILMKLCLDTGYNQGYIELLVGMSMVKELVKIGVQSSNERVLGKLKDCCTMSSGSIGEVIDLIISSRRRQAGDSRSICCLGCHKQIQCDNNSTEPLTWETIGLFIFSKLNEDFNSLEIMQRILPKLSYEEMDQMKELLSRSIASATLGKKLVERNQMFRFIKSEMNPEDASGELTEKYLNIYTMSRQELSGANWGRIITDSMYCDLCGIKIISKAELSIPVEIVAFCCSHTFHRDCFTKFSCGDECFLC